MTRVDGHVFQPLVPWIRLLGVEVPAQWSAKERCIAEKMHEVKRVSDQVASIQNHIKRKLIARERKNGSVNLNTWAAEGWIDGIDDHIRKTRWDILWEKWAATRPTAVNDKVLDPVKNSIGNRVVTRVDKHPGEGIIM